MSNPHRKKYRIDAANVIHFFVIDTFFLQFFNFFYQFLLSSSTVYDIFERKSIDIDLLISISEALQYDFIHEVYFPQGKAVVKSPRIFVAIEVEESEIEKMNLPEGFVRFAKVGE